MDAVKFLQERDRMCERFECNDCPIGKITLMKNCEYLSEDVEKIVEAVEKWSKENPEEIGKKYIIEIDAITKNSCHVKGTGNMWFDRDYLKSLEEYKESEE